MAHSDILGTPSGVVKILAFLSSVVALAMFQTYSNDHAFINSDGTRDIQELGFCTIGAPVSCFIMIYVLISYLFDGNQPGKHYIVEISFAVLLSFWNIAIGAVVIYKSIDNKILQKLDYESTSTASGVFYLLAAAMHLADFVLIFETRT